MFSPAWRAQCSETRSLIFCLSDDIHLCSRSKQHTHHSASPCTVDNCSSYSEEYSPNREIPPIKLKLSCTNVSHCGQFPRHSTQFHFSFSNTGNLFHRITNTVYRGVLKVRQKVKTFSAFCGIQRISRIHRSTRNPISFL
jgi:hypothetical protein